MAVNVDQVPDAIHSQATAAFLYVPCFSGT
jgi:hypothetical protein